MSERYEVDAHTADTGISVRGSDLAELFENAAFGMFDMMYSPPSTDDAVTFRSVSTGVDLPDLLVNTLSDLLYEAEARDLALCDFAVEEIDGRTARIAVRGIDVGSVELRGPPVKAVTYHDLRVEQTADGWEGHVIFDV